MVGIIALLASILVPSLTKAREQARISVCSNNLKQQSLAVHLYSQSNNGRVPMFYSPNIRWMWDMNYQCTRLINQYAGIEFDDNEIYVCPSNREREYRDRRWWQFTEWGYDPMPSPLTNEEVLSLELRISNIRNMPYLYMLDKLKPDGSSLLPCDLGLGSSSSQIPASWVRNLDRVKRPSFTPLVTDSVVEQIDDPGRFFDLTNGYIVTMPKYIMDSSNHRSRAKNDKGYLPSGANHCYVDCHVNWVMFNDMKPQAAFGESNIFWWKY